MAAAASTTTFKAPSIQESGEGVPDGKIVDFLTGQFFKDSPEEYVRQNIEKALVRQYHYDPKDAAPEFPIKVGASRKRVDIVVFKPGTEHRQENACLLVETKSADTKPNNSKEGIDQLHSYMAACVNCEYGLWTNGDDRFCFAKRKTKNEFVFEQILDIPAVGESETEAQRPNRRDLMPATGDNLLFAFRRCHNYIAANQGLQKPDAFWELLKLIFCKIEDERTQELNFFVTPSELNDSTAAGSAKTRIQELFNTTVLRKYPTIFGENDRTIQLQANVVAFVVSQLQRYSLLRSPVDVKGVAYEEIVGSNLRGDRGEFFTPRNACRMAVRMMDPTPDERLLDPACGTGGFLIMAMNHVLDKIEALHRERRDNPLNPTQAELDEFYRARAEYLSQRVFGLDLNPALSRAAKMNMVMNNDGAGGLWQANSLANPHTWDRKAAKTIPLGSIDVLFTNPPFGANILIDDEHILRQYDLAAVWDEETSGKWMTRMDKQGKPILQKSQPPEILFIERSLQFLREGTGRMAIVIPNGILNNPALGYVRHWLLHNAQILAVVDMARELFQPKNDTQTSMLLLRKFSAQEKTDASRKRIDYPVFMAIAEKIGHDKRRSAIYRRLPNGEDVLVERPDTIIHLDPQSGEQRVEQRLVKERVLDDELPQIADAFRKWLEDQE
ncbi:MAG: N-6 DNA methylase [Phycisphaeraceae bacterium]|nr:N-6 DNA methylase [Phycisphaeraceae bacterium]